MIRKDTPFVLITLGIFILLFFSKVFQHGLFFDGLIYASVSNNMANGIGSFWLPYFSETIYPVFYEHPPLVFGMEALFMKLFNGAFFSEKLFSFIMACFTILLIILIWRKVVPNEKLKSLYWLPVLFWIITPKNSWAFNNNLLENTMSVFSMTAIYLLLISIHSGKVKRYLMFGLAGVLLLCAFLSKGFPGLFPLGFFFLYFIAFRTDYTFKRFLIDTGILVLITGTITFLFFFFNSNALHNISSYIDIQVIGSISGKSRVGSRLGLLKNLFNELIPLLIISAIIFGVYRKKALYLIREHQSTIKLTLLFLLTGLSAALPLMISPKISSFYLIPALPYFALSFGFILSGMVNGFTKRISLSKIGFQVLYGLSVIAIASGVYLTIKNTGTVGRDHDTFNDMDQIGKIIEPQTTVSIHPHFHSDWTSFSYLQRYLGINVDRSNTIREYYLIPVNGEVPENYEMVKLSTQKFDLLKKSDAQ